ncbi:MAG: energy-coupling factor transporter ATPase [Clostridia bacterium]|nr:energy-coupling factor transporter ATPase [Clostridia bacterium]
MSSLLETKGLTHVYGEGTPFEKKALDEVSITFEQGDLVGIIGHTGSGKSTFIQHLNGLLKPTAGQVLLHGNDIWANPKQIRDIRFKVGMVFQYPEYQLFEETVYKDIAFGPKNMGISEDEIEQRVKKAASIVHLKEDLLQKSPFELSGGEKRRAAIAGVMAMEPEVFILDEPTAGLDPKGRNQILDQICAYREEQNSTVLFVSHSMEDIAKVAKKVLVMHKGKVAMYGQTYEVFSQVDKLEQMGLTVPAVTKIFTGLKKRGFDLGQNAYTIEQAADVLLPFLQRGGTVHD